MIRLLVVALLLVYGVADAGMHAPRRLCGAGGGGLTCTGSQTFIRGGNSLGDTEYFEMGSGDTCASDWTISGSTGINTYSTTQYKDGTHSLAMTDDTSTTPSYLRADHGSAQTAQYYRFWLYVPDIANYQTFSLIGWGKYDSAFSSSVKIFSGTSTEQLQINNNSTERIDVTGLGWVRVEVYVNDSDGSGAGYPAFTVKAWNSSGTAIQTTNGGGDYEITANGDQDAYRYVFVQPEYSTTPSVTAYIDGIKNCDTWCGE